jgi:hypothetical protein
VKRVALALAAATALAMAIIVAVVYAHRTPLTVDALLASCRAYPNATIHATVAGTLVQTNENIASGYPEEVPFCTRLDRGCVYMVFPPPGSRRQAILRSLPSLSRSQEVIATGSTDCAAPPNPGWFHGSHRVFHITAGR